MMSNERVKRIFEKSKDYIKSNEKIKSLIDTTKEKIKDVEESPEQRNSFIRQIILVVRMIQAHFSGSYPAFSTKSILLLVFGLVYFITPIDLIPDFIPGLGYTDDISILFLVLRHLGADVDRFKAWEASQAE